MPFIKIKTSTKITSEQEAKIKAGLGQAIRLVPGKSEQYLLLEFEERCRLWLRGQNDDPIVYIEAAIFGNEDHEGFDTFTAAVTRIFSEELKTQVFLGGSEPTTLKDLSEALGKETIDTFNTSDTRGNSPSYGTNYQKLGKELMSRDEIAVLDGSKCVLQLRGVRPFLSDKYDLTQHPNYKYTADFDKRYTFDIEKFLNHRMKLKTNDEYEVVEADEEVEETA